MYGTVAHLHVKTGHAQAMMTYMRDWERERRPKVQGAISGYLFKLDSDPHEMIMVAVFRDKESYLANSNDPGQDRWYQRMRALLEEDPVWEDGEIVTVSS